MAAHIITFKDPFRATTEFRFRELESFVQITQQACEEVARQENGILEETISGILKENESANPTDVALFQMHSVAEYVHTHHDAIPRIAAGVSKPAKHQKVWPNATRPSKWTEEVVAPS